VVETHAVAADADVVWTGWFARLARPMDVSTVRAVGTAFAILFGLNSLGAVPFAAGWVQLDGVHRTGAVVILVEALTLCVATALVVPRMPPELLPRLAPPLTVVVVVAAVVNMTLGVVFTGPELGVVAVYYAQVPIMAFVFARRPWAVGISLVAMLGYAGALVALDDPPAPVTQLVTVVSSTLAIGVVVGGITNRVDDARLAERRAKVALADLNEHLEARVAEQVDELERTGRLRRFLAPQVAEVVTSSGADELLSPHRREVAVLFCDLRGFTTFTNAVSPDHVVQVLGDYHLTVGSVLDAHGATVGGFQGDGIMAYIGDPVVHEDAARATAAMACDIAAALDRRVSRWSLGENHLGYGIGIAYGTATLGLVGYEGRSDYTPVGAVVNLAARLCADARSGEIVIDDAFRVAAGLEDQIRRRDDVELKGFGVVPTYVLQH
jgi:class 3 adenylate cyclase